MAEQFDTSTAEKAAGAGSGGAAPAGHPAGNAGEAASGGVDVGAQIDSLLSELGDETAAVSEAAAEASLEAGAAELETLASDIAAATEEQSRLDAFVAEVETPPEIAPPTAETVQSLDAQLAKLTDELLEEEAVVAPAAGAKPVAAARVTPVPVPAVTVAVPEEVAAIPEIVKAPRRTVAQVAAPVGKLVRRGVGATLALVTAPLAKPVVALPKTVRLSVSVLAAYTAALGAGAWGYIALRPPVTEEARAVHAFDFAHAEVPQPKAPQEHEPAAEEEHGAPDAHGAADSHGADAKKKAPAKKKPPAKKPPTKKPAKKETAGSGGH